MRIRERCRDEELGILRKEISVSSNISFQTPTKSLTQLNGLPSQNLVVNEISKRITDKTLSSMETGTFKRNIHEIKSMFIPKKLNLTIFDLQMDSFPNKYELRTLAQHLYASSDTTLFLPAVKTGLLKEGDKYSDKRIQDYTQMMNDIIDEIESVGNQKTLIGTIPLMPIKYSRGIIKLYHSKGLNSFAIDAGTKDIILNEADFRLILSEINTETPLDESFIFACNLGYSLFERTEARADDFLSIFAYVDVLGGSFKVRGGPMIVPKPPKAKVFSKDRYSYKISTYSEAGKSLGISSLNYTSLRNYNQNEQLKETDKVRRLIGQEKMKKYIQNKGAVDHLSIRRLESIAQGIKSRLF
jgi:hypothetical protein